MCMRANGLVSEEEIPVRGATEWANKIRVTIKQVHDMGRVRYVFPLSEDAGEFIEEIKEELRRWGNVVSAGIYVKQMQPSGYQYFLDIAWKPTAKDRYYQWKDRWFGSVKYE
jgi:hypothetical protein